jgi:hypothetical protein
MAFEWKNFLIKRYKHSHMRGVGKSDEVARNGNHEEYEIDECCKIAESMIEMVQMLDETKPLQEAAIGKGGSTSNRSIKQKLVRSFRRVKKATPSGIS